MSLPHKATFPRLVWCPKIAHCAWKLGVSLGRKDTVLTIRGLNILSEALPIILIYPRKVRKHSRSNGCMSLRHSTITSKADMVSKKWLFCLEFDRLFGRKDIMLTIRGSQKLSMAFLSSLIYLRDVRKHSRSN